jgi:hypothetical protein
MEVYTRIRKRARQIVSRFPLPDFYEDFFGANELSRQFFETDHVVAQLQAFVDRQTGDNLGHGLKHSTKVALDAGSLMVIEGKSAGYSDKFINRRVLIVQCAGLLHDIKRKQKDHAIQGAACAREVLESYPLLPDEIEDISMAIRNHEAFKSTEPLSTPEGALVSDCLYDGDKFRWGPDNFKDTVWDMVSFFNPPLSKFIDHYPKGMESVAKIKDTFRTNTGKKYGPQFINIGLSIGEELYKVIKTEFAHLL